jgi:hypothetical protein
MPRNICFLALLLFSASFIAASQKQAVGVKPQTPRQALVEMITKGGDSVLKHLTVEVQELLLKPENKSSAPVLAMLGAMKPETGLQTFEAGDVLLSYSEPRQHMKYEVHVDNDDMAGAEDTLTLSLHALRDGKEEDAGFGLMSSHFSVNMKQQQNIWRLNKISVGADFPVGDPEFVEKIFFKTSASAGIAVVPGWHATSSTVGTQPAAMPPEQIVALLALAQATFARQHPDAGFTCSLTELSDTAKLMGVDHQVSTGSYNGYRFALAGCEGKPAASFQITAEPITPNAGTKAFCTDATQNVRVSETGSGTNCLTFGKLQSTADEGGIGWDPASATASKPETERKPK